MTGKRRKDNKNRVLKNGEYQRSNGTYEYRWQDKKGKRRNIYGKSLEELRDKVDTIMKNKLDGLKAFDKSITVNDLFYRWIDLKRGIKHNTFMNYQYMYTMFVENDIGQIRIKDLKRSDIRTFYNHLAEEKGLKTNTIDNIHTVLHQVLELGVEDDYLRYNPSDNALKELKKAHNKGREKKKALTIEEQKLLIKFLKKSGKYSRWYPIIVTQLWTGMRIGELTGLRWCDVDFEENIIDINHTLVYYNNGKTKGCSFAINTPKTISGERKIPMLTNVKAALLQEKKYQEECEISCNVIVDGYTDFIFINRFGGVQHQGTINKALRRIIRDCNYQVLENTSDEDSILLPKFSSHCFRRTMTNRMIEAKIPIKAVQEILGHKDAQTTLNIYATASRELKQREMNNLESHFEGLNGLDNTTK